MALILMVIVQECMKREITLHCREITLNWNIPTKSGLLISASAKLQLISQDRISSILLSMAELLLTKLDSYYKGVDLGRYPTPLTLLFGLNVTF